MKEKLCSSSGCWVLCMSSLMVTLYSVGVPAGSTNVIIPWPGGNGRPVMSHVEAITNASGLTKALMRNSPLFYGKIDDQVDRQTDRLYLYQDEQ